MQSYIDLDFETIEYSNAELDLGGKYNVINYGISTDIGFAFNDHVTTNLTTNKYFVMGAFIQIRYGTSSPYSFLDNNIRNNHLQVGLGFYGNFGRWYLKDKK